jgi:hypothetical protein
MNITYKLYEVGVLPTVGGHQNVVARVRWGIEYEESGVVSMAAGESLLNVNDIQSFIPIEQLSREQVIDWAFATHGGDSFLQTMLTYHTQQVNYQKAQIGIVNDTTIFQLDQPPGSQVVGQTIPQSVA